jgi:hypothetical protein
MDADEHGSNPLVRRGRFIRVDPCRSVVARFFPEIGHKEAQEAQKKGQGFFFAPSAHFCG